LNNAMKDDAQLLRDFAATRSEAAFAEIVRRQVALVHSAALRQVNGDAHLAQDVTQLVFTDLARKAGEVARHRVLAGWLFTSTRFAAAKLVRGERRRQAREAEAHLMNEITRDETAKLDWERVRPVLDETLAELGEADREAILLRFFEGRDFAEVGARLQLSDNAARMRVERALDKLHGLLAKRGVTSTTAALSVALGANAGLAACVTGVALTGAGAVAAGVAASGGGWAATTFMTMTKLQLGISGALAVAGVTGLVLQAQSNAELREEVAALRRDSGTMATARAENVALKRVAAEVAGMRGDGAQFERLSEEAAALKVRMAEVARAASAQVYERAQLDQAPKPKFQARPKYPAELRAAGVAGEVVVEFVVDANGDVRDAKAVKMELQGKEVAKSDGSMTATGNGAGGNVAVKLSEFVVAGAGGSTMNGVPTADAARRLEEAAVEAVSQWKFDAGLKGGRAVNTKIQVPIKFTLAEGKAPGAGAALEEKTRPTKGG
jgi:RNA polymerase sigma factor (sigma-70 family)